MSGKVKDNFKQKSSWMRGLFIVLFAIFYAIAEIVMFAVVVFQFLLVLFTGESNPRLLKLGQSLGTYIYQIIQFMTYNSDYEVYPFGAWPKGEPSELKKQIKKTDEAED